MVPSPPILLGLTRRYCEPHRHYHSIRHIADMLARGRQLELDDEQVLAIWYHDAIHEVPGVDNERRSAELAVRELSAAGWSEPGVDKVRQIVLDTIEHVPTIESSGLVIDLDLASLADDWDVFRSNTEAIRAEYSHVGDAEFARIQHANFERFRARDRIFHTVWGERLEDAARANLDRALRAR